MPGDSSFVKLGSKVFVLRGKFKEPMLTNGSSSKENISFLNEVEMRLLGDDISLLVRLAESLTF